MVGAPALLRSTLIGDVVFVVRHPDAEAIFHKLRQSGAPLVKVMPPAMDVPPADQ